MGLRPSRAYALQTALYKMEPQQKYEAAANAALCNMLSSAGGAAASYVVWGLVTPGPFDEWGALAVAGISGLAYSHSCQWDTAGAGTDAVLLPGSCLKSIDGHFTIYAGEQGGFRYALETFVKELSSVTATTEGEFCNGTPCTRWRFVGVKFDDTPLDKSTYVFDHESIWTEIQAGTCAEPVPDGTPPPPYTWTDPDDGCQINVSFQGWTVDASNGVGAAWKLEPAATPFASGGIIGGCNFSPVLYYQPPGGGGGPTFPWLPGPDGEGGEPWWVDLIRALAAGVAGAAANDLLKKLFETRYAAGGRTIRAACQYKEDGTPETLTVTYPEETYQQRVLTALDAIVAFQQQILLWKTPICSGSGTPVTGDAVTINWVSDEYSPNGNDRIRKIFTYFDQVGSTLEQTVAHWKDFTWNAGPVVVSCIGTPLGKPQVWADSVDEAKRVIQHAATIAGVDLAKANWQVAPPKSSRYGLAGLMRVHRSDHGILGITKRNGPSGSPMGLS